MFTHVCTQTYVCIIHIDMYMHVVKKHGLFKEIGKPDYIGAA